MYSKFNRSVTFFTLIILLFPTIYSLSHAQQTKSLEDLEYSKLTQQQKSLEDSINDLVQGMVNVQKNVSKTTNSSEKVVLLQVAILSERQKVFNIRNQLIPPFSLSKTACLQLTNQQKIDLLDRIKTTKQELTGLQKQIATASKCDKINGLQKDTQKQLILLESLQKTIYTECESKTILTPTIYQTNIYSDGWILGDQNIDDLIQEYYQRNIRYHNITNCPLERPFFNGNDCMKCTDPNPVFNILTRDCTKCPEDQQADSTLRQCAWVPHYTNFSLVENWAQQGAPMPVPKRNILPCPPQKAYYNGKKCQVCLMPKYWSIQKNACVQCPIQTVFDVNDKKCQKPLKYQLTILQGTRWVTEDCNLTRVVEDRIKVLNLNKTKKYYTMCPESKPFYDGIICVNCANQFNVDTRRCVQSPNKTAQYDQNMRCYLKKQTGFQTDPRAANYTTKFPLTDKTTQNCRNSTPYYDGIACIKCLQPFPIFDVQARKCTQCDPMELYNNTEHKCIPRQKIYVSTNTQRLMPTAIMSIDDYHAEISQKIKEKPQAVVLLCKQTQYSDYKSCFNCTDQQYFNVQTKKCQICDGRINQTTKMCMQKAYIYTNLNSESVKRVVAVQTTIQQENATITKNLKLHNNSKLCPQTKPYWNGSVCTNCTKQSFNFIQKKCVQSQCPNPALPYYNEKGDICQQCPKNMRYQSTTKKCQPIKYVTNTNAIYFYIQQGNATKANLQEQIFKLQTDHAVITCDADHPYFNGNECIECSITRNTSQISQHKPYFNLKSLQCQACKKYDNLTHRCLDGKICDKDTPVLDAKTNTCSPCPKGTSYNSITEKCEACPNGKIFNPKTKACQTWVTNLASLDNNYIEEGTGTKQNLNRKIQDMKKTQKINVCPSETPFFSKIQGKCLNCVNPTPYFNILAQVCKQCQNYDKDTKHCQQNLPRFKMNVQDFYGTIFG